MLALKVTGNDHLGSLTGLVAVMTEDLVNLTELPLTLHGASVVSSVVTGEVESGEDQGPARHRHLGNQDSLGARGELKKVQLGNGDLGEDELAVRLHQNAAGGARGAVTLLDPLLTQDGGKEARGDLLKGNQVGVEALEELEGGRDPRPVWSCSGS